MKVSVEEVKRLREMTGAGVMDCKRALEMAEGDFEKAIEILRAEGLAKAEKRSGRVTSEGVITSYIHTGGRIGAMVELDCESDFVARTDEFRRLAYELAMQVAAMDPKYISRHDIPEEVIESQKRAYRTHAIAEGIPEDMIEEVVNERLESFIQEVCLLEQPYIRDETRTVGELIKEMIARLGENIVVRRFVRFAVGQ
ncbi:MAG: translation elongation factor Ts [Armatimonadota bacterium]|nr:translation elongation factor Ts [Armatimonadota bacterium]MCX7778208.1 translation elongation factor Ts [Armatimonadota bacterium]MDW8025677.1 translation elongation factor Ts [Armatimonadota bacterium]